MTHTYVTCPDCSARLVTAEDDINYLCVGCGLLWDLDGNPLTRKEPNVVANVALVVATFALILSILNVLVF